MLGWDNTCIGRSAAEGRASYFPSFICAILTANYLKKFERVYLMFLHSILALVVDLVVVDVHIGKGSLHFYGCLINRTVKFPNVRGLL